MTVSTENSGWGCLAVLVGSWWVASEILLAGAGQQCLLWWVVSRPDWFWPLWVLLAAPGVRPLCRLAARTKSQGR